MKRLYGDDLTDAEKEDDEVAVPTGKRDLHAEARSLGHMLTHFPKLVDHCDICRSAKAQKTAHRNHQKDDGEHRRVLRRWSQLVTLDTVIAHDELSKSYVGHTAGQAFMDLWSGYRDMIPTKGKTTADVKAAVSEFLGPMDNYLPNETTLYTDCAPEYKEATVALDLQLDTPPPG